MTTTPLEFPAQIDLVHFISHYAHDLRSPFNRMMGFLKIVLKGQDGPLTDLQKEDLNTVYQNSVYAFTMVANLIDISRFIAGEKSLNLGDVGVGSLFQQAIGQWQKYHTELPVTFETNLPDGMAPIKADSVLLSQAISGLIACVVECVKPPIQVSLAAKEGTEGYVFTLCSSAKPAPNPSHLDLDTYGYIAQTVISLHSGEIILKEVGDEETIIQFVLPKS